MPFLTQLNVTPHYPDLWQLTDPLWYVNDQHKIEVPEGFITDLASIPRVFRPLFSVHGRHTPAAVVHDWLYFNRGPVTRKEADLIFLEAMRELGVGWFKRQTMYAAVRLGGWTYWRM